MYEELVKQLRSEANFPYNDNRNLMREAADAIEELNQLVTFYESAIDGIWNDIQRITGGTNGGLFQTYQ